MRRATGDIEKFEQKLEVSIHALREESDLRLNDTFSFGGVSIHALREESDAMASLSDCLTYVSIHALREESDKSR